jgi:predicted Ser/Thr protein kinase
LDFNGPEIDYIKNITIKHLLGEGKFGQVYLGEWNGTEVALKKLREGEDMNEFYREAAILL